MILKDISFLGSSPSIFLSLQSKSILSRSLSFAKAEVENHPEPFGFAEGPEQYRGAQDRLRIA